MVLSHAVVFAQVTLRLIPKVLDPIYMGLAFNKTLRMIDLKMAEGRHTQAIGYWARHRYR